MTRNGSDLTEDVAAEAANAKQQSIRAGYLSRSSEISKPSRASEETFRRPNFSAVYTFVKNLYTSLVNCTATSQSLLLRA